MIKKILSILAVLAFAGYLVYSAVAMTDRHEDIRICRGIDLHISDSLDYGLIDGDMVTSLLQERGLDPVGLSLDRIDIEGIESALTVYFKDMAF